MNNIALIGDVHGHTQSYLNIVNMFEYSVQLGDMGFRNNYAALDNVDYDKSKHVFVPGNHDDYDHLPEVALKDYGMHKLGGFKFFFVRGAYSIDQHLRTEGKSWWGNEELNYHQSAKCLEEYEKTKPRVVLSHNCPDVASPFLVSHHMKTSSTGKLMDMMLRYHKPQYWIFGHHHISTTFKLHGTTFRCLNELEFVRVGDIING